MIFEDKCAVDQMYPLDVETPSVYDFLVPEILVLQLHWHDSIKQQIYKKFKASMVDQQVKLET